MEKNKLNVKETVQAYVAAVVVGVGTITVASKVASKFVESAVNVYKRLDEIEKAKK